MLAVLAALHGLSVIALDRIALDRDAAPFSRTPAAVFDYEIMRIFQMLGVAKRSERHCRVSDRYTFVNVHGSVLLDFDLGGLSPIQGWRQSYLQPMVGLCAGATRWAATEDAVECELPFMG